MTQAKILVVDDEPTVVDLVRECLEDADYAVFTAEDGAQGLRQFYHSRPDLAIIDILMPQMNGLQLCERIRELSFIPIIVLTAVHSDEEKVKAFSVGADDYVTKPVTGRVLIARVEAKLRRFHWPAAAYTDSYSDAVVTVDSDRHEVYVRGEKADLTPIEYRLLNMLVKHPGQALSHDQLLREAWGPEYDTPELVKWHVSNLRKKTEALPDGHQLITTIRGFGYRYEPPMSC